MRDVAAKTSAPTVPVSRASVTFIARLQAIASNRRYTWPGVLLAVLLLNGIPAFFTILPESVATTSSIRGICWDIWLAVAIAFAIAAAISQGALGRLAKAIDRTDQLEFELEWQRMTRKLQDAGFASFSWKVYQRSQPSTRLEVVWPTGGTRWSFDPKEGVVGRAFTSKHLAKAIGNERVIAEEWKLTEDQRLALKGYQAVVAQPVMRNDQVVAVLAGARKGKGRPTAVDGQSRAQALVDAADHLGTMLRS